MYIPFDYILLALVIAGINIVPAFMPPTWIILAFFYIQFHLLFIPTILIGATCATLGRVVLALLARRLGSKLIPKRMLRNYYSLGDFFEKHQRLTIPAVLMYAFFPISSNQVYIIAGLSQISLRIIAFSFLVGRLISYSFWVNLSYHLSHDFWALFVQHATNFRSLFLDFLGLFIVVFVGIIDWQSILKMKNAKYFSRKTKRN